MKRVVTLISTALLFSTLVSCVSDITVGDQSIDGEIQTLRVIGPAPIQFEAITGVQTKGTSVQDGSALVFNWAINDTLGIFPNTGNQVEFPITASQGSTSASFDGGGWALRNNASYAAYYPFSVWNYHRDNETILLDYSGQVQDGNGSFAHLSAYDYLASNKTAPQNSSVTFQMDRLGSILYIDIVVPEPETITALKVSCDEAIFVEKAELDISGDTPEVTPISMTEALTLSFINTTTTTNNETVRAYMAVQPVDFSEKTVYATLYTECGSYTAPVTSRVVNKGRAAFLRFSDDFTPVNIEFADAEVKRICVANWDTNGDGELSYKEASAVTDLGNAFRASYESPNALITSFDELQFFTGLTEICDSAFFYCTKLKSVVLPRGITKIGWHAFDRCRFTQIDFPESLKVIDSEAFSSLETCHISVNVQYVSPNSGLYRCPLTAISVDEANQFYCSRDGVLFNKSMTELVCYPPMKEGTTYSIPFGVTTIGSCAFYSTKLVHVEFPESLLTIKSNAFRYARRLVEINLPTSLIELQGGAFEYCDCLTSITIPEKLEPTTSALCNGGNLQEFIVDPSNEHYKAIDGVLFDITGTKLINYPTGRDGEYIIPQGVTIIGCSAFANARHLNGITIPEGVTRIDGYAFFGSSSLESIVFPSSLSSVGPNWISSTNSVTFLSATPLSSGYSYIPGGCTIYVPNEAVEAYKSAWSAYADRIFGIDVNGTAVGPGTEYPG